MCEQELGVQAKGVFAELDADEKQQLLALLRKVTFPSSLS